MRLKIRAGVFGRWEQDGGLRPITREEAERSMREYAERKRVMERKIALLKPEARHAPRGAPEKG